MKVIKLTKTNQQQVLKLAVDALKKGQAVAYPTDTSYGLGVLAIDPRAVKKLYAIKERGFNKAVHVLVPSVAYAKKILKWNQLADKLAKEFLPGPLSIALPLKQKKMLKLTAGTGYLGIRISGHNFSKNLVSLLRQPITATSANPAGKKGGFDSYSADDVLKQFKNKKHKPDLIIDAGKLKKNKPSTFVKIIGDSAEILRQGPIAPEEIAKQVSSLI